MEGEPQMTARYLVRRVGSLGLTLLIIITIIFFMFRVIPGDVVDFMVDPLASEELKATIRQQLGLDRPLVVQYGIYLRDLITGNLGMSYYFNRPVTELVSRALVQSIPLAFLTFFFSYLLGGLLGVFFAWKRGSRFEQVGSLLALVVKGAPPFWVGLMLIYAFALYLGWLPEGGMSTEIQAGDERFWEVWFSTDFLRHLVLPVLTGTFSSLALPILLMRGSMMDALHEEYMDLARAKGLKEWVVIFRHGVRNALLPMVAQSGTYLAWAIGGLVTVEVVFAWPGLGRQIVQALLTRDYPLAQGAFVYITLFVMALYLIVDFLIMLIDPRADLH